MRVGAFFNQEAQAYQTAGERAGQAVRNAGDTAVNYMDHQQINAGADHGANLFASLTDSWNKASAGADPHDPAVAKKWREEQLEPALQQFQQGFTTQKSQEWASHFVNSQREHFFAKTEADMSSLAKEAVTQTVNNLSTKLSNAAVNDPSSVDASVDMVKHSINGILASNPNIKGPDAGRVRMEVQDKVVKNIIHSGAMGAILNSKDPEAAAAAWAKKYPDYINGAEELQLAKAAKTQVRTNNLITKQTEIADRQIAQHGVEAARNKIWSDNVQVDPVTKQITIKPDFFSQVTKLPLQYPKAPNATETAKTLLDWGERVQNPEKGVSNPAALSELDSRMFAADGETTDLQVLRAEANGQINHQDSMQRRELIKARDSEALKDPRFQPAMNGAKELIEGRTAAEKSLSAGKFAAFQIQFLNDYIKQKRAGTLPADALDINNPDSLINKTMKTYVSPLGEIIRGNGGVTPTATPTNEPPVSLPSVKDRVKGRSYMTGRGMMEWTGTGWISRAVKAGEL